MSAIVLDGFPASEGIGLGRVHILRWGVPEVEHRTVAPEEVAEAVLSWAARVPDVLSPREHDRIRDQG
ncbi:MAG: hypothetical protein KY453_01050 [Gemmatimonadetes bacterium]|nr:hypothetical protein [Gemmatimonadota bacterium]